MTLFPKIWIFLWTIPLLISCIEEGVDTVPGKGNLVDTGVYDKDSIFNECEDPLVDNCWDNSLTVLHDCHYNLLYTRYNNGWTGADGTYSFPLPDGRILWFFGDTFLGTVKADRTREGGVPFINNSLVVQEGDEMTTLFGGDEENPKAFFVPGMAGDWYWPFDGTVKNGQVQVLLAHMERAGLGGGMWDFQYASVDLAILSLPDLKILSINTIVSDGTISYGSCLMEDDNYIYIYGITSVNLVKNVHVARAANGDLTSPWEYFDGSGWINTPVAYTIHQSASDMFSVIKDGGKYYLITQEIIFGDRIFVYESDTPVGPWLNQKTLYCTPESGGDIFTYNSFVHPELSEEGELVISYNINSFDFSDLFENADNYRPKFIRVYNWK